MMFYKHCSFHLCLHFDNLHILCYTTELRTTGTVCLTVVSDAPQKRYQKRELVTKVELFRQ